MPYTNTEDKRLVEYLALHNTDGVGRKGNKLYQELVNVRILFMSLSRSLFFGRILKHVLGV